jgi:serine protease Do
MKLLNLTLIFIIANICFLPCIAETITLKQGQTVNAPILHKSTEKIVIDLGVTVISVPMEDVLNIEYDNQKNQFDDQAQQTPDFTDSQSLYHQAQLPKTTIEKCLDHVSQGVVKVATPAGMGSGFFINERGYLITNHHVIAHETKIEVTVFEQKGKTFEKKRFKKVKIIAINPFVDLALLKVEDMGDTKPNFVYLGNFQDITAGQAVFAVGNPLGLERTVTNGVISTTNRAFEGLVYIQTNADINPGNSGGPLFDLSGQVIGVTNMGYIFFGGLGFAIPVDYVKHFIDNRESFAYDKDNPNSGFRYIQPDARQNKKDPKSILNKKSSK